MTIFDCANETEAKRYAEQWVERCTTYGDLLEYLNTPQIVELLPDNSGMNTPLRDHPTYLAISFRIACLVTGRWQIYRKQQIIASEITACAESIRRKLKKAGMPTSANTCKNYIRYSLSYSE